MTSMTVLCVFSGGSESDMQQNAYCKYSSADLWSALGAFTMSQKWLQPNATLHHGAVALIAEIILQAACQRLVV